jgi:hypothetical protein
MVQLSENRRTGGLMIDSQPEVMELYQCAKRLKEHAERIKAEGKSNRAANLAAFALVIQKFARLHDDVTVHMEMCGTFVELGLCDGRDGCAERHGTALCVKFADMVTYEGDSA